MADFGPAYAYLRKLEGTGKNLGYVDIPSDRGGETIGGISRRYHPTLTMWRKIDELKGRPDFPDCLEVQLDIERGIETFFRGEYWDRAYAWKVTDQAVANEIFEFSVHTNAKNAVQVLQRCLNFLNYYGRLYADIDVDGFMGPLETLPALAKVLERGDRDILLKMFNVEQGHYYNKGGLSGEVQEKNIRGFYRRVEFRRAIESQT